MSNTKSTPEVSSPAPLEELEFRGGPNEDVSSFLGAIKRAAVKQGRHLDNEWMISYAESCLRGDAMDWFDEMGTDITSMDWISLRKAFLRRFRSPLPPPPAAATEEATITEPVTGAKAARKAIAKKANAETEEVGSSAGATGKKVTGVTAKKTVAAEATSATEAAAAAAEAASRAATAAAKRAATAAAMATKAAEAAAEAAAAAAAEATGMKAAVEKAALSKRPTVQEVPAAPLPITVGYDIGDLKAKCLTKARPHYISHVFSY
ncbi:hypothetical protein FRB94_000962 [Tulasnella sp. JGI-2019a]|nr:hypothetical protein FRB94_000962 [Tulasnella sp. JGI-2019a]